MNSIHYEPFLVALSYVISVFGSYTALQLAIVIPQARTWGAIVGSVLGAATAVGGGAIWSMHFIGMNAADLGIPVAYDPVLTILSLVVAILAPAVGLFIVGRSDGGPINLPLGGLLTGAGVALMHYTGMAAMIMPAKISYDTTLFWAANLIAIVAATVALWLAFNLRGRLQRFGSAFVMGIAVCGMHYTGMYALKLEPTKETITDAGIALSPANMAYSVFGVTAVILTLLLLYGVWRSQRTLIADL
jgi:NO-binding membrane sensor protein with MHYT domain